MNRVREWRRRKGMSMEELARRSRTTASTISKLERGERRLTLDWMTRLAKALGCQREDLWPSEGEAVQHPDRHPPVDRELLRRMGRVLETHLAEEKIQLPPLRFLEAAMALHDLTALRPVSGKLDKLPPALKTVIRLIAGD